MSPATPTAGVLHPQTPHPSRPARRRRGRPPAYRAPAFRRSVLARLAAGAATAPRDQRARVAWPAGRLLGEGPVRASGERPGWVRRLSWRVNPPFQVLFTWRDKDLGMEVMHRDRRQGDGSRRPTALDMWAAGLLLLTVILHMVAMFPRYFGGPGEGSVWSQPDQAALFSVLTAGWALALGLVLAGPARARLGAAVAVGLAVTELGFRLTDVDEVLRFGGAQSAVGMWLMTAAWLVGSAGAVLAVLAVRRRSRPAVPTPVVAAEPGFGAPAATMGEAPALVPVARWGPEPDPEWAAQWGPQAEMPVLADPAPAALDPAAATMWAPASPAHDAVSLSSGAVAANLPVPVDETAPIRVEDAAGMQIDSTAAVRLDATTAGRPDTTAAVRLDATAAVPVDTSAVPAESGPVGSYGALPTLLVAVLALVTAGAFLPAWDHYVGVATTTGRSIGFTLGNAFTGPWPVVIGNVVVAVALVAVPVLASRLRDRRVAAAAVAGSLIVLASQFTAAIVQVDRPVSPSVAGLTPAQSSQLGLQLHLSLTGWFTLDVLAAYALFAAVMVVGYLRPVEVQANSAGTWPSAPEARSPASLPWS